MVKIGHEFAVHAIQKREAWERVMTEICIAKRSGTDLVAVGDAAETFIRGIERGEVFVVKTKHFRHLKFFKKVMATLREVYDNQEKYNTFDRFLDHTKLRAGHTESGFIEHDGEIFEVLRPATVSLYGCDEEDFQKFAARLPDALSQALPGAQHEDLIQYVEDNLVGGL